MSQTHNALRRGQLVTGVRKMVGDDSGDAGLERYSETLHPILNPWGLPEWALLRGELLWARHVVQPIVAAEFSAVGIVNPAGSGKITIIDAFYVRTGAASDVLIGFATQAIMQATLAGSANVLARDLRAVPLTGRTLLVFGSDAATGSIITQTWEQPAVSNANTDAHVPPVIIAPGFGVAAVCNTVATAISGHFVGRERSALPGELV